MIDKLFFRKNKEQITELDDEIDEIAVLKEEFNKEQTIFKNQLAHSIRMPLAVISGYGDLIKKGQYDSEEKLKEYLDIITNNINFLNISFQLALTDDKYIKPSEYKKIDLLETVKEVVAYSEKFLKQKNIKVEVISGKTEVNIYAGKTDIIRIIYNLIENTYKYMSDGYIYITVDNSSDEAIVIFRDDGKKNEMSEAVKRNGFGHNMIREIMSLHRGKMEAKNSERGYTVILSFKI